MLKTDSLLLSLVGMESVVTHIEADLAPSTVPIDCVISSSAEVK